MWFLVVAVITGHGLDASPYRTDIYMERGFTKQANCLLAAERYEALKNLTLMVAYVKTSCEFQP